MPPKSTAQLDAELKGHERLCDERSNTINEKLDKIFRELHKIAKRLHAVEVRLTTVEVRLTTVEGGLTTVEGRLNTVEDRLHTVEKGLYKPDQNPIMRWLSDNPIIFAILIAGIFGSSDRVFDIVLALIARL